MTVIRMAFSCTCQPNRKDVHPHSTIPRIKSILFVDLWKSHNFQKKKISFKRLQFELFLTCYRVQMQFSIYMETWRLLLLGMLCEGELQANIDVHILVLIRLYLMMYSMVYWRQLQLFYLQYCRQPRNLVPNMHGTNHVWMGRVAIEP